MNKTLKKGSSGDDVIQLRKFLVGLDCQELDEKTINDNPEYEDICEYRRGIFDPADLDEPKFGPKTEKAVVAFQNEYGLVPDGVVGKKTWEKLISLGFPQTEYISDGDYPLPLSDVHPLVAQDQRFAVWGKFEFESAPIKGNPERIVIKGNWIKENVIYVKLNHPVIKGMKWHKDGVDQLRLFFWLIENQGLFKCILTYSGSFVPRYVRGSKKNLSNHSWATAFDINVAWNKRGTIPALRGQKGSVRELINIWNVCGGFWGGHYNSQLDGMHFELCMKLSRDQLTERVFSYGYPLPPLSFWE